MVDIVFETHATTRDNETGHATGHADVPLSPVGESQARELGERYRTVALAAVYCSDLSRSYATAEIAFAGRSIPIHRDRRLRECDYGSLTGALRSTVSAAKADHVSAPFPGGESYTQAVGRTAEALADIATAHEGERVLIIGHRATQYTLEHLIHGVPLAEAVTAHWQWQPGWRYRLDRHMLS